MMPKSKNKKKRMLKFYLMMIIIILKRNPNKNNRKKKFLKNHYPVAPPNLSHKRVLQAKIIKKVANKMSKINQPQMLLVGIHSQQNHKIKTRMMMQSLRKVKIKRWK